MKQVHQINCWKGMTANELTKEMSASGVFGAGALGRAIDIYEKMILDQNCRKFLGFAGALVPGGMKNLIVELIEERWADVAVTTGANLTHDLIEALGHKHLRGESSASDAELNRKGLNRIYNSLMPKKVYVDLEKFCFKVFDGLPSKKLSIRELLQRIGEEIPENKKNKSILSSCYKKKTPLFCPALADSGIGLMIWSYSLKHELNVDAFLDLKEMLELCWPQKKDLALGAVILGGGVPKNFIAQSFQFSPRKAMYAVQITMDRPEHGGSSGAELREAISWGKLDKKAEFQDVICDATIALPLMLAALKERIRK
ncbi:MAG: deoxyhypusine synthase family protein [Candidatus Diapherotrites archaeon]